jgi:hypothetical protein
MSASSKTILAHLAVVERERARRAASPALAGKMASVKHYQQRRFSHTYADLLSTARYGRATTFFLEELYGPADFSQRDAQFARVIPALVRLFPGAVIDTVVVLAELHALSESLDTAMGEHLSSPVRTSADYVSAWRAVGQPAKREQQIALTLTVGASLDSLTRKPLLRQSLRMMRGPANAAGLSALQGFLESGFDAFAAMRGAGEFLTLVGERERRLAVSLFGPPGVPSSASIGDALGQLP